jgi:hypothetical protein
MISRTNRNFWICFKRLPIAIQRLAVEKFHYWLRDPFHTSLRFKELSPGLWSVRINRDYRALARKRRDLVVWFWIGSHKDYDRLVQ